MNDSAATEGRLPAAVSLLLGCAGLGWLLLAVQTSAERVPDTAREPWHRIETAAASELELVSLRPDGEGRQLAAHLGVEWLDRAEMGSWWGPAPHHASFAERAPDGVLLPSPDQLLLHRFSDDRLVGNHGGLTDAERRVPLLVAG